MKTFKDLFKNTGSFQYLKPYIIAEIGVNHENSMEKAKLMIEQVAESGGHCAKFQTYKADKLASDKHAPSYWDLKSEPCTSQHALFQKYDHFGESEYQELAAHCKKVGIDFLSTPFDVDAVTDMSDILNFYKVASADITNIPLLRTIGKQNKPVIVSVGAATLSEVENAINVLEEAGASDIALLHCVLNYPTPHENAQMSLMSDMVRLFGDRYAIGYSDHVKPEEDHSMPALEIATINGAVIIEKHYTYDKTLPGNDHYHAFDAEDMKIFSKKLKLYQKLYGGKSRNLELEAKAVSNARRRILTSKDVKEGDVFNQDNLIALRSNKGIDIARWDDVVGKKASNDLCDRTPVNWKDIAD